LCTMSETTEFEAQAVGRKLRLPKS